MPAIHARTYIRHGILAAAIGFGLVVGGCGNDGAPQADSAAPDDEANVETTSAPANGEQRDPCTLLSREEVEAVVGNPLADGKEFVVQCIWESLDMNDPSLVHADIAYMPLPPGSDPDEFCENGMSGLPNSKPFPGIGRSAWWAFTESRLVTAGTLHVCLDTGLLQSQVLGKRSEEELQQMALAIANTAISRL